MRTSVVSSLILAVAVASFATLGCTKKVDEPPQGDFKPTDAPPLPPGPVKLEILDELVGTGIEAKKGDMVKVHYTGTLLNGKMFDTSRGKDPFQVVIGAGGVIKGWDEGLPGMRVGGKRKLTIPWTLAYGEKGSPPLIPPRAALSFDIELMEIVLPDAGAGDGGAAGKDGGAKPALTAKDGGAKK
jgi:FKBP-type peptidyl-prolyl cis-trans isomerase FkpA